MADVHDAHPISRAAAPLSRGRAVLLSLAVYGAIAALLPLMASRGALRQDLRGAIPAKPAPWLHVLAVVRLDEINPQAGGAPAEPKAAAPTRAPALALPPAAPALDAPPAMPAQAEARLPVRADLPVMAAPALPSAGSPASSPALRAGAGDEAVAGAGVGSGRARGLASLGVRRKVTPVYHGVDRFNIPSGIVLLAITIDADGVPVKITPVSGDARLWPESIRAARQWRWDPPASVGLTAPLDLRLYMDFQFGS